ncbi:MAG TPA: tRNA (adenosine(37)-N6)-dimethylallyltransferase MiaA [Candidatus Baltobacteraceae bacterium]|nr:tRNA (adenosine(37)-N6)-dimethylallyltransferase MiaA [Candidatus Baltobacteraceae bacterium]
MSGGVLVLAGATASGKTELAVELAQRFDAEIVGADSRQIYRGMEIGTAMPSARQFAAVRHHLVDFLDPFERYSAARYVDDAMAAIADIRSRGKRVIVAGGTGFYIRALLGRVDLAPQYDEALRRRLAGEARLHPPEVLHAWLSLHDRRRAEALDPGDSYRVLRALEIALTQRVTLSLSKGRRNLGNEGISSLLVFLDVPLDVLDERIARRAEAMLERGFVEEAERVGADAVAADAVGYPQALAFTRGWSTERELRTLLARATRRYARRQRAWFRGESETLWLQPGGVERAVRENLGWPPKRA